MSTGWSALGYLVRRTLVNMLRSLWTQLKQPKYLISTFIGVAYFGAIAIYFLLSDSSEDIIPNLAVVEILAPPALALLTLYWWIGSTKHSALAFSPSEVQFLFQAPIPRRSLVQYKLLRAVPGLIFAPAFLAVVGTRYLELGFWPVFVATWSAWTVAYLHQVAAALTRTNWQQRRADGRHGSRIAIVLFAMWAGAVLWGLRGVLPAFYGSFSFEAAWLAVQGSLAHPVAVAALLPYHVILAPVFASDISTWSWLLLGNFGLIALHYRWILRVDAAFEEGAAAAGEEAAESLAAIVEGRAMARQLAKVGKLPPPWFTLSPTGPPAFALFWKNFLSFTRTLRPAFVIVLVALFALMYLLMRSTETESAELAMAMALSMLTGYSVFLGPFAQRNDLRSDLPRSDVLRTYPLSGASVALAEVGSSTASLTVIQGVALFGALVFVLVAAPELPWAGLPAVGYIGGMITLAFLNAIGFGLQNLLAVWFPEWYQLGPTQKGMDAFGGQMLLMAITAIGVVVLYLVPVAFAGGVGVLLWPTFSWAAAVPAAAGAWVLMAAEIVVLLVVIGRLYEDLDPVEAGILK